MFRNTIQFNEYNHDYHDEITRKIIKICDSVTWTNYGRQSLFSGFLKKWDEHPIFIDKMAFFKDQFIESFSDNIEYGEVIKKTIFTHYRFSIDGNVKYSILELGISKCAFVGLWDPCFYRGEQLIASTVCHEGLVTLFESIE